MTEPRVNITLRMGAATARKIRDLAAAKGMSMNEWMLRALADETKDKDDA